jgi:hypothetical protein
VSDTLPAMDLSKAKAVESGSNDDETTTTTIENDDEVTRFVPNEAADGYATFADSASLAEGINEEVMGNDPLYKTFDLKWSQTLEDYPEVVQTADDPSEQDKLALLHNLTKGTFGGLQSDLNEGYGPGWDTDKTPPKPYENKESNKTPYLRINNDLPAFDTELLTDEEVSILEDEGMDMDNYGFDRSVTGPRLPRINGKQVPVLVEDGDEVMETIEMLESIDLDEVTYCPENGELQGTPTLGPSGDESETEKVAESTTEESDEDYAEAEKEEDPEANAAFLAKNPEATNDFTANGVKAAKKHIDSMKTLQVMRRVEADGDTRSTALNAIKSRIKALDGDDEETEEETETEADDDPVESEDGEMTLEEVANLYDFSDIERDAVKFRVENDDKEGDTIEEAAKIVSEM